MNKIKFISYNKDSDYIDVTITRKTSKHYRYKFASDQVKRIGKALSSLINNDTITINTRGSVINGTFILFVKYTE